ncbi:MAG: DUF4112 domain-containing protein [Verrucomicrobiaceae bacterium]|nr:DUF4112 domain-containing protein [Verrucomicrobiaceae bacterium]
MSSPDETPAINPIAAQIAKSGDPASQDTARLLAKYLDEWLRVPGTQIKIGLDPILALFPGIGDVLVSGAGGIILVEALRSGVSFAVFLRMALNMTLNFLLGLIPGGGALLSIFYKSNTRNLAILQAWQAGQHHEVKRGTFRFFMGILMLGGLFMLFLTTLWLLYSYVLYQFLKNVLPAGWI